MDESFAEETNALSFLIKEGKTYFSVNGAEFEEFSDFSLKFIAETVDKGRASEGSWLSRCTALVNRELVSRDVLLTTSAFDSKQQFLKQLRQTFQGGTFSFFPDCTHKHVNQYYRYLKKDFEAGDQQQCSALHHVGHQGGGYWFISDELQINYGKKVPRENWAYKCKNLDEFKLYFMTIEEKLLSEAYLSRCLQRFISLSSCWGVNQHPFMAATAFICQRLVTSCDGDELADEANIGMLSSPHKSVGKSLTAKLLAYGQGVPQKRHNQLLAGGDQVMSGISVKKMMEILAKTSFVVIIDDAKMTDVLSECLLHVHGGLLQGSSQGGTECPLASVLLTSNSKEPERLHGRVMHFNYERQENFSSRQDNQIKELFELVTGNRGILTAWAIRYAKVYDDLKADGATFGTLADIIRSEIEGQQTRWYKGVAALMVVHTMLCMSCGLLSEAQDFVDIIMTYIKTYKASVKAKRQIVPVLEKTITQECLNEERKEMVKTWLNPSVKVSQDGNMVPGLAIKSSILSDWQHISREEVANVANKNGSKTVNISVPFYDDINNEKKINKKAIKLPKSLFSSSFCEIVEFVCGTRSEPPTALDEVCQPESVDEEQRFQLKEETLGKLRAVFTTLLCDLPVLRLTDEPPSGDEMELEPSVNLELTPKTKRIFNSYTPRRRRVFEIGYSAGKKQSAAAEKTDPQVVESFSSEHNKDASIASNFSPEGSIGVSKRTAPPKNGDEVVCKLCSKGSPPGAKKRAKKTGFVDWVQCDDCDAWFHLSCSGLQRKPKRDEAWYCKNCLDMHGAEKEKAN